MSNSVPNSIIGGRIDDFAKSLVLFERMEKALLQRIQANPPGSEAALLQLAACKRKQGQLDKALLLYLELVGRYPENLDYSYTAAALQGRLGSFMPDVVNCPCACPLVEQSDFLPAAAIQKMIDYVSEHQADFQPSLVKNNGEVHYDSGERNNKGINLWGNTLEKMMRDLIVKNLPEVSKRLGLTPFDASRVEVKLQAYHNGEYFRVHQDGGKGRLISYTYFFHPEPKRFQGGELIIFDTDVANSTFNHSFTRVMPKRNSVFFFPSHFYHAVLPVETQSSDFMSARFVINGHIWGAK